MKKRTLAAALSLALLLSGCGTAEADGGETSGAETTAPTETTTAAPETPTEETNDLTSLEVIRLMGNGTNLGNTLEAYNHSGYVNGANPDGMETGWGQPYTTPEMFEDMKSLGFDTVRIPIAWTNGINYESGDYTIDERLMSRVETVVNYALDADLYVIINDHWDGSWWGMFGAADETVREQAMELYRSMWTQIGERFKDYSYKLIFEGANEELGDRLNDADVTGSKGKLTPNQCYEKTNEINAEFVKTIRAIGGKNADRFLLVAGYNTDIEKTCDDRFKMPEDSAENKLLLSVHYYTPWDYCGTDSVNTWGSPSDYEEQNRLFEMMSKYSEQGYGVVIGEYAVMMKNGGIKPGTDRFYDNVLDNCDLYDFCPVLWDCSNFYKRSSRTTSDDSLKQLFDERRRENEASRTTEEIKAAAREKLDETYKTAQDTQMEGIELPPSDDMAIAWIMYASSDYGISYSVGDTYDPTNCSTGIIAKNAEITGEGTYTVSLDLSGSGTAKGVSFSALGISNGESFFPGYTISIDEILINGEAFTLEGKEYTSSDDGKCTRVNLYNSYISDPPPEARTPDGDLTGCSPQIMPIGKRKVVETIEVTFTLHAP
ncbi:MAG: glycoside hydrolase family 5 protein [Bacteroides sp.]|nr:glycoside hydrolase family 5 protein [Eubacterium sp.]MCM1417679.1 glycoside hydrolase family 5 protein [Roseburia sp.]MCM1461855.1 glycoside hydrolase family 5 protein [Bacteroides sp.]